jgi:CheY-like chemotaxis protein
VSPETGELLRLVSQGEEILEHARSFRQKTDTKMRGLLRRQRGLDAYWAARTDIDPTGDAWGRPHRCLRVLLVEDHPDAAASTALLLRYFGHDVIVAHDGPAALELARRWAPDVALLDIGLPKMDGYEVARQLVALCRENKPALIAVSGYGGEEQARRCAAAGIELLLLKPVDPEQLRLVLLTLPRAMVD